MNHEESQKAGSSQQCAKSFEAAPVALMVLDLQGKITSINAAMEAECGQPRAKLIGTDFWECFAYPDDARAAFETTLHDGSVKDRLLELVRREGFPVAVQLNAAIYYDDTGKEAGVVAAPRNVVAFKRTELEFQKRCEGLDRKILEVTAQSETATRELDAFPFWMIEDLKAPLHGLAASVAALNERHVAKLEPDARVTVERIAAASAAMNEMVEGLRRLTALGRQKLDRVTVDLTAMATQVTDKLQASEPDRRITFVIAPQMTAHGDPQLLVTVFEKLIGNAWKSLAGESAPIIEIGVLQGEDVRAFFVRDNSFSSPTTNVQGLLRPARQPRAASDFSDTGISRATVRRIIHRHGGRVWAESHRGKGTAFYFTLPD